jgi:photosystem II stability/assembly factor-like uncharacterized protein
MTDDELGRRLHDELQSRIDPPSAAPEAVREHLRNLRSMQEVRLGEPGQPHSFRNLLAIAAAVAVIALLTTGLLTWQSLKPRTAGVGSANGIEMFARLDSKVAWAESGSDLYVTRDGGVTWTQGTVPGGRSLGQMQVDLQAAPQATPNAAIGSPEPGATPGSSDTPAQASQYNYFPNHLYPSFIDADHGWLLSWTVPKTSTGDWTLTVHRTGDGGRTWASTQLPGTYKGYGLVQFTDAQHGWVTVYRLDTTYSSTAAGPEASPTAPPAMPSDATTVLATSDGGATWSRVSTIPALALLRFTSASEAWGYIQAASGSTINSIVHSTDGGHTWQTAPLPIPEGYTLMGTPAEPPTRTTDSSLILRVQCTSSGGPNTLPYALVTFLSADDGRTWTLNSTNSMDGLSMNTGLSAVLQLPPGQPIVAYRSGQTFDQGGSSPFKASFDGGATWIEYQAAGLPSSVSMAQWTSPDDVWVLTTATSGNSNGRLYATHDQGKTWTALMGAPAWPASLEPAPTPMMVVATAQPIGPSGPTIDTAGRVDAKVGWVVETDSTGSYELRLTDDGGATWTDPRSMPSVGDVQFVDADHGWILSSEMTSSGATTSFSVVVLRTADGGRTWEKPAGTDLGTIPGDSGSTYASTSMHFRDALHGELFGSLGSSSDGPAAERSASPAAAPLCEQLSTSDGGATWSKPKSAPCMMMTSFTDATLGYGSDPQGAPVIHLTVDGGQTWIDADLPLPAGASGAGSSGTTVQLLERRADGTLRALVSSMGSQTITTVVVSSDGGKTWTAPEAAQGLTAPAYGVAWLGEGHWLALGQTLSSVGTPTALDARVTEDGGATWKSIPAQGLPNYTSNPHFVSATDGWVAAADLSCSSSSTGTDTQSSCSLEVWALYATNDGGNTWQVIFKP